MTLFGSEQRAYQRGVEDGERRARIRAHAALRRAATHARSLDASARALGPTIAAEVRQARAESIRTVIRAAIGSEKP